MLVAAPRFGQQVDVAIAVHVGSHRLVLPMSSRDDAFLPIATTTVFVGPDEPHVYLFGQRPPTGKDVDVAVEVFPNLLPLGGANG